MRMTHLGMKIKEKRMINLERRALDSKREEEAQVDTRTWIWTISSTSSSEVVAVVEEGVQVDTVDFMDIISRENLIMNLYLITQMLSSLTLVQFSSSIDVKKYGLSCFMI